MREGENAAYTTLRHNDLERHAIVSHKINKGTHKRITDARYERSQK